MGRRYLIDWNDGETVGEVDLADHEIDYYEGVADALGLHLSD